MSLRFLSNDYLSSYAELLEKSSSVSMETKRLRMMVCEIFKTLKYLNPVFMKDIFHYSPNVTHKKHNLYIHTQNTTKFGNKNLSALVQTYGTHCLNTLNWLLYCYNVKNSVKHGQDQNANAAYANENET